MKHQLNHEQKIPFLVITEPALIFIAMIGLSLAFVYSMARLQKNIHETYMQPMSVNNAGLDVYTSMARLRTHVAKIMLGSDPTLSENLDKTTAKLERNLSNSFGVIKAAFRGDAQKIHECEQLLEDWKNIREI